MTHVRVGLVMRGLVPGIHVVAPMHQSENKNSGSRNGFATYSTVAPRPDVDSRGTSPALTQRAPLFRNAA